jgi:hypothetical protein
VCDGEDNNGDGFIDENLYDVFYTPVALPDSARGAIGQLSYASRGGDTLLTWIASGFPGEIRGLLLDAGGRPRGQDRKLADANITPYALTATPDGYAVAYFAAPPQGPPDQTSILRLARVDALGIAAPPEDLGTTESSGGPIGIAWTDSGPVVSYAEVTPGCSLMSCPLRLFRPGASPQEVQGSSGVAGRYDAVMAANGAAIAIAWTECPPTATDGGLGPPPGGAYCSTSGPNGLVQGQIRIVSGPSTVDYTLAGANRVAIAWRNGELLVAWHDIRDGNAPRIALTRLSPQGAALGEVSVSSQANRLASLQLGANAAEAALVWSTVQESRSVQTLFFARVDPVRGRIGDDLPLDVPDGAYAVSADLASGSYLLWVSAAELERGSIRCTDTPRPRADGGVPAQDGGAPPDAGTMAPDAGTTPPGPACDPIDPDGGTGISGRIRMLATGPLSGASVIVGSCRALTDADGSFSAAGVMPPVDLSVLIPARDGELTAIFLDVPIATPEITLPALAPPPTKRAVGVVADYTTVAGEMLSAYALFDEEVSVVSLGGGSVQYLPWVGPATATVDLLLIDSLQTRTSPLEFTGGQLLSGVTITDGAEIMLGTPNLVATSPRSVSFTGPASSTAQVSTVLSSGGAHAALASQSQASGAIAVPGIDPPPPWSYALFGSFHGSDGSAAIISLPLDPTTTTVTFSPPPAPVLLAPAPGASGVGTPAQFEVSAVDGAQFYIVWLASSAGQGALIIGTTPPLRFPDLTAFGRSLAAGHTVQWFVTAAFGADRYEDFLRGAPLLVFDGPPPAGDTQVSTPTITFTP